MAKKPTQGTSLRSFGEIASFRVGESALHPGEVHITQYGSELVGPLSLAQARSLAVALLTACDAIEGNE